MPVNIGSFDGAFPSNAVCNPFVFAMVKSSSLIVACFPSNADCNPVVFAMVKSPSPIVACFPSICVWIELVTPCKYPNSACVSSIELVDKEPDNLILPSTSNSSLALAILLNFGPIPTLPDPSIIMRVYI